MKTLNIVVLVAIFLCIPLVMLLAANNPPTKPPVAPPPPTTPPEKPLKDMTIEELLAKLETGPDQTDAFEMFLTKFQAMLPQINHYCMTYRGYNLENGLLLNFEPLPYPNIVVVPLGPAIMAQLGLTGGVIIMDIKGENTSGLEKYDIITAVNGTDVADIGGFYKILGSCPPDKETDFSIIRGGKPQMHKIRLWSPPFGAK